MIYNYPVVGCTMAASLIRNTAFMAYTHNISDECTMKAWSCSSSLMLGAVGNNTVEVPASAANQPLTSDAAP